MTSAASFAAAAAFKVVGVLLERIQRVSDILKGGQNRAAILFGGLRISGFRGALPVKESAAVKDGLRDARAHIPKARASREYMAEDHRHAAGIRGQRKVREPIGNSNADLGAGGMQVLLGLAHIGTLLDELRRKAHRQFLRQLQTRKLELFSEDPGWETRPKAQPAGHVAEPTASAAAATWR